MLVGLGRDGVEAVLPETLLVTGATRLQPYHSAPNSREFDYDDKRWRDEFRLMADKIKPTAKRLPSRGQGKRSATLVNGGV